MDNLLITFIILSIFNVILSTIKSILTVQGSKTLAAAINAVYFGLYTIVIIYMTCELALWLKVAITAATNFIGVYIVKYIEERARKDRLWKIEITVDNCNAIDYHETLKRLDIPHNYITGVGKWAIFNCYCSTKEQSAIVRNSVQLYKAKYTITEAKQF